MKELTREEAMTLGKLALERCRQSMQGYREKEMESLYCRDCSKMRSLLRLSSFALGVSSALLVNTPETAEQIDAIRKSINEFLENE